MHFYFLMQYKLSRSELFILFTRTKNDARLQAHFFKLCESELILLQLKMYETYWKYL